MLSCDVTSCAMIAFAACEGLSAEHEETSSGIELRLDRSRRWRYRSSSIVLESVRS